MADSLLPPSIIDVRLDGSEWIRDPYSYADTVPTGKQLAPIFTDGVDKLQIVFSEHVDMEFDALKLWRSDDLGPYTVGLAMVPFGSEDFEYDSDTHTATWTFNDPLPADKYRIELDATQVTDAGGLLLDGDWHDFDLVQADTPDDFSDDPTRDFPTGNGTPGTEDGAFRFHFSLLPGDSNQDGLVTDADLVSVGDVNGNGQTDQDDEDLITGGLLGTALAVRNRQGSNTRGGDYNDDDKVDEFDFVLWRDSYGNSAPVPDVGFGADGNGNGVIDAGDYTIWSDNRLDHSAWTDAPMGSGGGGAGPIVQFGVAPTVINVTISGSASTHDPYSFDSVVGSGEQLRTVPVGGADTIAITFSEDVNVSAGSLDLIGLYTANQPTLAEFAYDLLTQTATWRFEGWTLGDQYLISLSDGITDVEGDRLDGEWTNPASISTTNSAVSEFPSGNSEAGGDFKFIATLLPGDANLDLVVSGADFQILQVNYGTQFGALFTDGDFNGNGAVNIADFSQWQNNYQLNLQNVWLLADLNGDWSVDEDDLETLVDNWVANLSDPTWADGDLDGDGEITVDDIDLMFAQYGLGLAVVS